MAAFTIPKLYVTYKGQIDGVLHVAVEGLRDVKAQVSHAASVQLDKVKDKVNRRGATTVTVVGDGRTKKLEAELKTSGGKISAKMEKKTH